MSLYGLLFGQSEFAPFLKAVLGLGGEWRSGRFRDIHLNEDGTEIVLYTRNGGGNREHWPSYEEEYVAGPDCPCAGCVITYHLPQHPNYLRNRDDDFDSTYAYIYFSVPEEYQELCKSLATGEAPASVHEKFSSLIEDLKAGKQTPQTEKALEVGKAVFGALEDAPGGAVIEVSDEGVEVKPFDEGGDDKSSQNGPSD